MSEKTLIRGGTVLTLGTKTPNFGEADVLIADGKIAEVGPGLRSRDAETVDATDTIVMPGFVDAHRHAWKSLFRNLDATTTEATGVGLGSYLRPDDVYAATLVSLLGAIESGITTLVDWFDLPHEEALIDASLQAHADAGLRTVFVLGDSSAGRDGASMTSAIEGISKRPHDTLTSVAAGPADLRQGQLEQVITAWTAARELGLRIHAHAGMHASDSGVIAELATRNMLGPDVTLSHCTRLSDSDLDAIAASGTAVCLTPSTDMTGALGSPPIQQLLDRKISLSLGVDDEMLAPGDIFAQMRAVISVQHATYFDLKLAGKAGLPNLLTTRDVIRYGTVDGSSAVGLQGTLGSLTPGKQADLIILRTDRPNIYPINDAIGAVVWGMDTSNLDSVFVAGKALMRDGDLKADVARARLLAMSAHGRVTAAAGLPPSGATEIAS